MVVTHTFCASKQSSVIRNENAFHTMTYGSGYNSSKVRWPHWSWHCERQINLSNWRSQIQPRRLARHLLGELDDAFETTNRLFSTPSAYRLEAIMVLASRRGAFGALKAWPNGLLGQILNMPLFWFQRLILDPSYLSLTLRLAIIRPICAKRHFFRDVFPSLLNLHTSNYFVAVNQMTIYKITVWVFSATVLRTLFSLWSLRFDTNSVLDKVVYSDTFKVHWSCCRLWKI